MPAADFCRPVRADRSTLSPDSRTCDRSPEVSSTAFRTQPPNLPPAPLMDMGFAVSCQLARRRRPHIRFLFIGSRFAPRFLQTPPRDDALALRYHFSPSGCEEDFHLQAVIHERRTTRKARRSPCRAIFFQKSFFNQPRRYADFSARATSKSAACLLAATAWMRPAPIGPEFSSRAQNSGDR